MPHQPPDPDPGTSVRDELAAMRRIVAALEPFDPASRARIVGWMFDRYPRPDDIQEPTP